MRKRSAVCIFPVNSGSSFCRIGSIPLHQAVIFHDEGARCVLSPRSIVLFHQIIAQCGSIPQLHQPVGFLKGNLLHEAERSVRGRQQHAHMPDEQRVLRLGKPVMQNDRDQPCAAVRKTTPRADQPACSAATCSAVCVLSAAGTGAVQAIYIFITYNLCTTVVYTALNLPYGAMAPLMTNDEQDLAKINLFRMSMSPIGYLIVSAATLPIINRMGGDQAAWIKVTIIYSLVAIALLLWCFLGTKERVQMQAAEEAEESCR